MRNIFIINASQVITSDQNPQGVLSNVPNFPVTVDSRSYPAPDGNPNGNPDTALVVAQAEFADEVKALTVANNPTRVMWAVTLTRADGVLVERRSFGAFPDMTPAPEPTPEPNEEQGE